LAYRSCKIQISLMKLFKDTETLGYVGEETNKKLMYLAATSRLLDDPISILILSESGSGKSYLVDTIKKLMPPEDVIDVTQSF
jgi:predicted ATPase with chaperone activity